MITCYLDSQDYSVLTDPKLMTPEKARVRDDLLYLSRSNQVRFAFSEITVCENVSPTPDASHLAELKGELISDLCGSNALVSIDKLVDMESRALAGKFDFVQDAFDSNGRWFPDIFDDLELPNLWGIVKEGLEDEMRKMGLSRQERRAKTRSFVKNGLPRAGLRQYFEQLDTRSLVSKVVEKYPMKEEYATMIGGYFSGNSSEKDFIDALTGSLNDIRWIMKWFTTDHALSSPIAERVRKPGRDLGALMRSLAQTSIGWSEYLKEAGMDRNPTKKGGTVALKWKEAEQQQLIAMAKRMGARATDKIESITASDVRTYCPGLSACVSSFYSSVWANVGAGRKEEASDSQPVDALHAFYVPYVKIFRADRFMAPHIQKSVEGSDTVVVPLLSKLNDVLSFHLR